MWLNSKYSSNSDNRYDNDNDKKEIIFDIVTKRYNCDLMRKLKSMKIYATEMLRAVIKLL